ncbi:putative ABC transporter permease protein [Gordonia araii NBRC 100433]|uniref:Putative ABC transporter permease protein n=1 Tax=Gordonia araii NBRC 100433 TaxID=1073574 RepID=G7H4U7_9ACTN|nr:ABC transporter permease [Gordonia araii]NNG97988.1 ABC transporter permease [Gordonia araii NBRC 100433]GAB10872.1 putative ABC transporter permease protein [Gordonia araii NBRC 100433]
MTQPDTIHLPSRASGRHGPRQPKRTRFGSLAKAEWLQFRRNKTLVVTGVLFPIATPLAWHFIGKGTTADAAALATSTLETFALMALVFVQYYSVLSMVTTRRGEGVLKRLRTGESTDREILSAPAVPGLILTLIGAVVVGAVVYATGAPAPVNPLAFVLALAGGAVVFTLLALATSVFTKNAEAAQITSMPVMVLAIVGLGSIRSVLPDRLGTIADWTPFAAVSDLIGLGAAGTPLAGGEPLRFAESFADFGRPLVTLGLWAAIAFFVVYKRFRWDDRG